MPGICESVHVLAILDEQHHLLVSLLPISQLVDSSTAPVRGGQKATSHVSQLWARYNKFSLCESVAK